MRTADRCAEFSDVTGTDVAVGVPFTVATSEVPAGSTMSTWPCANATFVPVGANVSAVPPADTPALIAGSAQVQVGVATVYAAEMVPPTGTMYVPAPVPAVVPLTLTLVIVAPFAAITAVIGVAYGLATATVVAGNAGAALRTGAARVNGHSHREQRNVSAPYGANGPSNQQRGHVRYATSAGWSAEPASGIYCLRPFSAPPRGGG